MKMEQMVQLANALVEAEVAIKTTEEFFKEAKKHALKLREETLPAALQELGVEKLVLSTGQIISMTHKVYATIPKDGAEKAFNWLINNNLGDVIKSTVKVDYGRGEIEAATNLINQLAEVGVQAEFIEGVHNSTLTSTLNAEIKAGHDVPLDLFNGRAVFVASVK